MPRENYASGFGLDWTKHARTQYDSYSGIRASEQRFYPAPAEGIPINWRLLVADYSFLGLQGRMLKEWAYLDT